MRKDSAIVNLPLAKRGNIDVQLDAYKCEQAKLDRQESIKADRFGVKHLYKGEFCRVFANRTQAEKAAVRTGGEAYQSRLSARFLVRFAAAEIDPMDQAIVDNGGRFTL